VITRLQQGTHQQVRAAIIAAPVLAQVQHQAIGVGQQGERCHQPRPGQIERIEGAQAQVTDVAFQHPHLAHARTIAACIRTPGHQPVVLAGAGIHPLDMEVAIEHVQILVQARTEALQVRAAVHIALLGGPATQGIVRLRPRPGTAPLLPWPPPAALCPGRAGRRQQRAQHPRNRHDRPRIDDI
jgi:hypothetical protein